MQMIYLKDILQFHVPFKLISDIPCVQEYILKGVVNAALGQEMGSVSIKPLVICSLQSYVCGKDQNEHQISTSNKLTNRLFCSSFYFSISPSPDSIVKRILCYLKTKKGNSLVVQWLGLGALTARDPGSSPGWGTKVLQAAQHGQKNRTK